MKRFFKIIFIGNFFFCVGGCDKSSEKIKILESVDSKSIADGIPSEGGDMLQAWLDERSYPTEKGRGFKAKSGIILYSDSTIDGGTSQVSLGTDASMEISNFRSYVFFQGVDSAMKLNGVTRSFVIKFLGDAARVKKAEEFSEWFGISRSHFLDPIVLFEKDGKWAVDLSEGTGSGPSNNQWKAVSARDAARKE